MPDSDQSTSRSTGRPTIAEARSALEQAVEELRRTDGALADLARRLPQPGRRFDTLAEFRAAVECARADLLRDAIETLETVNRASAAELRRRFEERRGWRVANEK